MMEEIKKPAADSSSDSQVLTASDQKTTSMGLSHLDNPDAGDAKRKFVSGRVLPPPVADIKQGVDGDAVADVESEITIAVQIDPELELMNICPRAVAVYLRKIFDLLKRLGLSKDDVKQLGLYSSLGKKFQGNFNEEDGFDFENFLKALKEILAVGGFTTNQSIFSRRIVKFFSENVYQRTVKSNASLGIYTRYT